MTEEEIRERALNNLPTTWVVVVGTVLALVGVTVAVLISAVAYQAFKVGPSSLPPLLTGDWAIEAKVDTIEWRDGQGIPLIGGFQCSADLDVGTSIQFRRSLQFVSEDGESSLGVVPIDPTPPIRADSVCSVAPQRDFTLLWSNVPEGVAPEFPAYATIRYSAEADGYNTAAAQTQVFMLTAPG